MGRSGDPAGQRRSVERCYDEAQPGATGQEGDRGGGERGPRDGAGVPEERHERCAGAGYWRGRPRLADRAIAVRGRPAGRSLPQYNDAGHGKGGVTMNSWRNVWTITKRELGAYFSSPLAYVFIVIFLLLCGFFTFFVAHFLEAGEASLVRPFFDWHPDRKSV